MKVYAGGRIKKQCEVRSGEVVKRRNEVRTLERRRQGLVKLLSRKARMSTVGPRSLSSTKWMEKFIHTQKRSSLAGFDLLLPVGLGLLFF